MRSEIRVATNQAPLLVGHNVVTADAALVEAVTRHGSADVVVDLVGLGRRGRHRRGPRARACSPTSTTRSSRRTTATATGSTRSSSTPSWHWLMERAVGHGLAAAPWESDEAARARAPGRRLHGLVAHRAGARLPDLDDVRRRARAARRRRPREGVDAAARVALLRPRRPGTVDQARRARRHGHDREAGRLRRPGQRHRGAPYVGRRRLHPARAQVVHLGADERRVPGARAGRGRGDLLRGAAGARRRDAQPARRRTPQGQARQPVQRVVGAGVRRHARAPARRRGPRRPHDHRDGRGDPARLRARLDRR